MNWDKKQEISEAKVIGIVVLSIGLLIVLGVSFFGSWYTVPSGHRGVIATMGEVNLIEKEEGFGWKLPILQKVTNIEVRTKRVDMDTTAGSKDLQDVTTKVTLNYRIDSAFASDVYQNVGLDYENRIIKPAIEEVLKKVTAQYTAEECITKRNEVRQLLETEISERLKKYHILVDDVAITDFNFSDEFNKAIEQKVTAEQLKLKASNDLERIKIEKEQKIVQAQAEAESIRIQTEALAKSKDVLELRWIEKWSGELPLVLGGSGQMIDISALMHSTMSSSVTEE